MLRFKDSPTIQDPLKRKRPLNDVEHNNFCKIVVKVLQYSQFFDEIKLLKQQKPHSSKLLSLNIFLDADKILRVRERFSKHEPMTFDSKHAMLIPKNYPLKEIII